MVKNGHKGGKQLYKCKDCNRQFVGGDRLNPQQLESDYIDGKQTLIQLSKRYGVCVKTVWNILSGMRHKHKISKDKDVIVLMDATYWSRRFGVVIIKDAFRNKVLWFKFIKTHESVADYVEGVRWLEAQGFRIYGIVCDGMKGLLQALRPYPVQMCQFHMINIVRRYLTTKPDVEASRELLALTNSLSHQTREDFKKQLNLWFAKWEKVVNERTIDANGKSHYTRPRLRAAFHSLRYHLPWLWTFARFRDRHIPNTNAGIESLNARLKTTLRVHSGISAERRKKLIENFFAMHY